MIKSKFALAVLTLAFFADSPARAQVTIDLSKITCEQLILWRVTDPDKIAYWLSGYYSAKRGTTVIDMTTFEQNVNKVKDHCRSNFNQTVMQAVDTLIGAASR